MDGATRVAPSRVRPARCRESLEKRQETRLRRRSPRAGSGAERETHRATDRWRLRGAHSLPTGSRGSAHRGCPASPSPRPGRTRNRSSGNGSPTLGQRRSNSKPRATSCSSTLPGVAFRPWKTAIIVPDIAYAPPGGQWVHRPHDRTSGTAPDERDDDMIAAPHRRDATALLRESSHAPGSVFCPPAGARSIPT